MCTLLISQYSETDRQTAAVLAVLVHTCNPSPQEVEAGGPGVQAQCLLQELVTGLGCVRICPQRRVREAEREPAVGITLVLQICGFFPPT